MMLALNHHVHLKSDNIIYMKKARVCASVTMEWRVLRLWMEERPPIWRVTANKLNKQSRTADKGWSSSLGVGGGADIPHRKNISSCEIFTRKASDLD